MRKVNIHEAKTNLSQLVEAAEAGEKVVLARAGKPVAELVRISPRQGIRFGVLKGMFPDVFQEAAVKPLSKRDFERLFRAGVEP
jgi:prevent-host-death family protein